jgi:acetyl esterase
MPGPDVGRRMGAYTSMIMALMAATYPDLGGDVVDAAEARRLIERARTPAGPKLRRVEDRVIPGTPPVPVRVYWPDTADRLLPVVIYFHGGGFALGSIATHEGICRSLAAGTSAIVMSVDYRLAPEHKYPAAVIDSYAVLLWAHEHAGSLGGDRTRIAVAGDSAGGNLAAVCCLRARDEDGPPIAFQLLIYPYVDLVSDTPSRSDFADGYFLTAAHLRWFREQYLDRPEQAAEPHASPVRAGSLAGLPPALVVTAECDPLRDEGARYVARVQAAGGQAWHCRAEGLFHGFFAMTSFLPEGRRIEQAVHSACSHAFAAIADG